MLSSLTSSRSVGIEWTCAIHTYLHKHVDENGEGVVT